MNRCRWAYRLWLLAQRRAASRFAAALTQPKLAQERLLLQTLRANQGTNYGRRYGFAEINSLDDYRRRVPMVTGAELTEEIGRIRRGEENVLTDEPVTRLIPTSGTTDAAKLIPYTAGLQRQFNAGIGPWIVDLFRQHPSLAFGPAYWSISPINDIAPLRPDTAVPVGFDDDTAYLGPIARRFADTTLAAPSSLRSLRSFDDWQYATLWWLLRARGLRLVSVWHPSFWTLLTEALPARWGRLIEDLARGQCQLPSGPLLPIGRVAPLTGLQSIDPSDHQSLWPELSVISAWGDASAQAPLASLQHRWQHVAVQAKGILSTEAFLSLPWQQGRPAAVCSHVIEFLDDHGDCFALDSAELGGEYEPVVTTAGGLYRYRTGDRVRINGRIGQTPTLNLLGRTDATSDLCGEKLNEAHVRHAMQSVLDELQLSPTFSVLAPADALAPTQYEWFIDLSTAPLDLMREELEQHLMKNPHYAYARRVGQLRPLCIHQVGPESHARFLSRLAQSGQTLGAIKPTSLSQLSGWTPYLC